MYMHLSSMNSDKMNNIQLKIKSCKQFNFIKLEHIYTTLSLLMPASTIQIVRYNDVIMSAMASQIISFPIVFLSVYTGADQRKHQSSASLAFVGGFHRWPVNSPHKGPVTRKMFPFDDGIMEHIEVETNWLHFTDDLFKWMFLNRHFDQNFTEVCS